MTDESKKILIVEDDPFLVKVLGTTLEDQGFSVDRAVNGKRGLDEILHHSYNLVILDILLPKMNGIQVLEKLKKAKNKTPVLIFTNLSHGADREKALRLGAKGFYVKSDMSVGDVVKIVRTFLC